MLVYSPELFELQLAFAERVRLLSGHPLEQVLLDYTNLYVRFGLGRDLDPEHPDWRAYLSGLRSAADPVEWTHRFYLRDPEASTAPTVLAMVGCFSYAIADDCIRLHFQNVDPQRSPLALARAPQRRAELAALFELIKRDVREDLPVVGRSWLYNLEAYRRLFPPAYTTSARILRNRFRSMPLWGQFVNRHGDIKPHIATPFLETLAQHPTLDNLDACFPLQVLTATAPQSDFLDFYGV
ncbi:MAG: hypothetical protein OXT09_16380 [Myxococcales bacterium]|nr:hypothetical protein [Myxococcales bacterium]